MDSLLNYRYSLVAGAFAAGGSFFGKLPSHLKAQKFLNLSDSFSDSSYLGTGLVQVLPLVLMVICNVSNLRCFLKALQMTEQTLTCVVLTAASNYILSFILGALVYQEPLTALSGVGITLIVAGLWFLCDGGEAAEAKKKDSNKEN
ncbi:uncharacterized protein Dana_GF26997 [Drosophila ananassae]|uniref:EamA domain-containing protein n=1 Tax=Drosophila ananassae TaxID=7217 RepID=A0A0P8XW07_DROAN|nr:uncharacterized protein LOC26514406 [Drosophila ananassae]KPU78888.1 uncharacterized protein Dana_GF26997 [Drosophila ananassae]